MVFFLSRCFSPKDETWIELQDQSSAFDNRRIKIYPANNFSTKVLVAFGKAFQALDRQNTPVGIDKQSFYENVHLSRRGNTLETLHTNLERIEQELQALLEKSKGPLNLDALIRDVYLSVFIPEENDD